MSTHAWRTTPPSQSDLDINDQIMIPRSLPSFLGSSGTTIHISQYKDGTEWRPTKRTRKQNKAQLLISVSEACATCRFYRNGECRRRAPVEGWGGSWPQPMDNDWCGEWEAKP